MPGELERKGKIVPPVGTPGLEDGPPAGPATPRKPPVEEPEQGPPVKDPAIRKGPAGDPGPAEPARRDPPAEPPEPGEPTPTIEDPLAPDQKPGTILT
jgi:hypothetical protein